MSFVGTFNTFQSALDHGCCYFHQTFQVTFIKLKMKTQVKIKKEVIEDDTKIINQDRNYSKLRIKREPSVEFEPFYLPSIDETQNQKEYSSEGLPLSQTIVKSFKCEVCSKLFTSKPSLQRHVKTIHRQSSDFECSICKKICPSNLHLLHHQSKHIDTKDYQCKFCDKKFASEFYVTLHEKRFHGEC